ncbi:Alpha/Beta hydrolase protein [Gorgonomyces haynaldii]|nr:Alpha/Beta hydrolase protein [Gorgonomyces haynaldii]
MHATLKGTIADEKPRWLVGPILVLMTLVQICELGLYLFGLILWSKQESCPSHSHLFLGTTIATIVFSLIFFVIVFAALISSSPFNIRNALDNPRHLRKALTPLFIVPLSLNFFKKNRDVSVQKLLGDVADLIIHLLGPGYFCPSDVLVGLVLIRMQQKEQRKRMYDSYRRAKDDGSLPRPASLQSPYQQQSMSPDRPMLDLSVPFHMDLKNIKHFLKYAEAIYGLPLYAFSNPVAGLRRMLCPCLLPKPATAVDSIQMSLNENWAFGCLCCCPVACINRSFTHEHVVYSSIDGDLFKSPFFVALDESTRSLVVSIRGTMSTSDLLADLLFKEQTITWMHDGVEHRTTTHHGVYQIALNIWRELNEARLLEQYADYRLVVTGHSLGGAVAALLAFVVKNESEVFRDRVYAFCFATPGSMITADAIWYFKTFCTSTLFGYDLATRLSPSNVYNLKNQIMAALKHCHVRKVDIIASELVKKLFGSSRHFYSHTDLEREPLTPLENYEGIHTFMPGNILHIVKMHADPHSSQSDLQSEDRLAAYWVDARDFDSILVTSSMAVDHLPNVLADAMDQL